MFRWLQAEAALDDAEMLRTFNCGVGMVIVVARTEADAVEAALREAGESPGISAASTCARTKTASASSEASRDDQRKRVGVLISGRGSNLQALISACKKRDYPAEIVLVISNVPQAQGLLRAEAALIPTLTIDHKDFPTREAFDAALDAALNDNQVELLCNAGFLRLHARLRRALARPPPQRSSLAAACLQRAAFARARHRGRMQDQRLHHTFRACRDG